MENIKTMLRRKPRIFMYATAGYLLLIGLLKWIAFPSLDALWFFMGGAIGLFFLDAAEVFFALSPSPFRSIVFSALFAIVALFIVTSSTGTIGSGLVLSLYLQILLWQFGELRMHGNINSWYRMIADPVPISTQKTILGIATLVFLVESYLFIR